MRDARPEPTDLDRRSLCVTTFQEAGKADRAFWRALGANIAVTDGDSLRVDGEAACLVGFNAPETSNAQCDRERDIRERAGVRLGELVTGDDDLDFEKVASACRPGTEGTTAWYCGRSCGALRVAGRDGWRDPDCGELAVPLVCGERRCPPTPRP